MGTIPIKQLVSHSLANTLSAGATTSGNNITISSGDSIIAAAALPFTASGNITMDATGGGISLQGDTTSDLTMAANNAAARTLTISASNSGAGAGHLALSANGATYNLNAGNVALLTSASDIIGAINEVHDDAAASVSNLTTVLGVGNTTGAIKIEIDSGSGGIISSAGSSSAGIALSITSGAGDTGFAGGSLALNSGTGGATSGAGGNLSVTAGSAVAGNSNGGNITITSGAAFGSGTAGTVSLLGAIGATGEIAGGITITGGIAVGAGTGGSFNFNTGGGGTTGDSGGILLNTGAGGSTSGNSGNIIIDVGTVTSGTTGTITIGDNASTLDLGNGNVANVVNLGSTTGAADTNIFSGTGGISFTANGTAYGLNVTGVALATTATTIVEAINEVHDDAAAAGGVTMFDASVGASGADYTTVKAAYDDGKRSLLIIDNITEAADLSVTQDLYVEFGVPSDGVAHNWDMNSRQWDISSNTTVNIVGHGRHLSTITSANTDATDGVFGAASSGFNTTQVNVTGVYFDSTGHSASCALIRGCSMELKSCIFNLPNSSGGGPECDFDALITGCFFEGGGAAHNSSLILSTGSAYSAVVSDCWFDATYINAGNVISDNSTGLLNSFSNLVLVNSTGADYQFRGNVNNLICDFAFTSITLSLEADYTSMSNVFFQAQTGKILASDYCTVSNCHTLEDTTGVSSVQNISHIGCSFDGPGGVYVVGTNSGSSYVGCNFADQLTPSHNGDQDISFSDCEVVGAVTTSSNPDKIAFTNCRFRSTFTVSAGADNWSFANCTFEGAASFASDDHRFDNCIFNGTVTLTSVADNCSFYNCQFDSTFTDSGGLTTENRVYNSLPITVNKNQRVYDNAFKIDDGSGNVATFAVPAASPILTLQTGNGTVAYTSDIPISAKSMSVACFAPTASVTSGDGAAYMVIPEILNTFNLVRAQAVVIAAGVTGATTIQIHNVTQTADMLTGLISIASGATSGTVGTIDAANDDVATDDVIRIDVDTVSTGTAPLGLIIILTFDEA